MTEPVFDRCPGCDAEWSYVFTYPGWDGSLPATRALVVADGVQPVHLRCPDCGHRVYAEAEHG